MSISKVFASSQPASQPTEQSALLSYLFETSFKNAPKITQIVHYYKLKSKTLQTPKC